MTIVAVGLAGIMRIIRNLIWGEGIFFRQDFFKGVRIYGGKFVIVFALGGLVNAINTYIGTFSSATEVVLYLPKIFSALFLLPACLYTIAQIVFYNDKLTRLFSNGIRFAVATFPITLLFTALLLAPWLMDAFSIPALLKYGLAILLVFFVSPMYCMAWLLRCCHNFDRFINKETYPEIYDKGVYRLEKEEKNDKE